MSNDENTNREEEFDKDKKESHLYDYLYYLS